ncbi:response regulator [Subdoligranulum variabile]|uniref:response regulator n=1 Tax=Subdoligranulum variabile TaxID=214851 RepID=UPI0026EBC87C|nr:response regulator [Subdoligranulum variabile]
MTKEEPIYLLIAEDEHMLRNGLASLGWAAQGITLLPTAKNGLQAVEIATEHTVDILLSDIRMPGLSGMEVAQFVRDRYPGAEILFLSEYEEFDYAKKAISLHPNNYILKPAMPQDVLRAVGGGQRQNSAAPQGRGCQTADGNGTAESFQGGLCHAETHG